jgi:hypothetical protein
MKFQKSSKVHKLTVFVPFGKKIRQTHHSWTAQYFPLSFVGQICKFNVLLGTKKLQLFLASRTNQTNLVSLGLFCLAGNTWTKIRCPFEGKDKLCLDWHKKLQLLFGFLFMRFLCHFCLAQKIRQTWLEKTRRPFDGEQLKNVSLSVVGDFRHQLFFLKN